MALYSAMLIIATLALLTAFIGNVSGYTLVQQRFPLDDPFRIVKPRRPIATPASLVIPAAAAPAGQSVQSILTWLGAFYLDPQNGTTASTSNATSEQQPNSVQTSGGLVVSNGNPSSDAAALDDDHNRFLRPSAPFSKPQKPNIRDYAFGSFLDFQDLIAWYDMRMNDNNADNEAGVKVERQVLTTTEEGRPVLLYKISSSDNSRQNGARSIARPVLWMDCLIHAREWVSGSTCSFLYNRLLRDSRTDSTLRALLQKVDVWIAPVLNPDGYAYTHSTSRFWRKNRQQNPQRPECPGIDLNRNWPAFYTQSNLVAPLTSSDSCDDLYAGPTYLTTRETKGVFDFLVVNRNLIKVALTFHSFGQLWLIPYGYSEAPGNRGPKFPRYDSTYALFKPVVDTVQRTRRVNNMNRCSRLSNGRNPCEYEFGNTVDVIQYAGGGGSDDTMAAMGICHVATVELPPTGGEGPSSRGRNGFDISPQQIVQVGDEIWQGMRVLLKSMADTMTKSYCLGSLPQIPKFKAVVPESSNSDGLSYATANAASFPVIDGGALVELESTDIQSAVAKRPFEQNSNLHTRG